MKTIVYANQIDHAQVTDPDCLFKTAGNSSAIRSRGGYIIFEGICSHAGHLSTRKSRHQQTDHQITSDLRTLDHKLMRLNFVQLY